MKTRLQNHNLKGMVGTCLLLLAFQSTHAAPGGLDPSFDPVVDPGRKVIKVRTLVLQNDGKVLIGGWFTSVDGVDRQKIARLNDDGTLDPSFDPRIANGSGSGGSVWSIALQSDQKVVIGGWLFRIGGRNRYGIARLHTDGSLDNSFDPGMGFRDALDYAGTIFSLALQTDGKVLAGGDFMSFDGAPRQGLVRLDTDGSLDTSFDVWLAPWRDFNRAYVYSIFLQRDGKVLVGGMFSAIDGVSRDHIVRLNSDGSVDHAFDVGSGAALADPNARFSYVTAIAVQDDGKVLIGGLFDTVNGASRSYVARLHSDGSPDLAFNAVVKGVFGVAIDCFAFQPDGKILVGGHFSTVDGVSRNRIARLHPDGSLDQTFDPGSGVEGGDGFYDVRSIALQPDGNVLIAGDFQMVNGIARNGVARLFGGDALPRLNITRTDAGIAVSWPVGSGKGYMLETGDAMSSTSSWAPAGWPSTVADEEEVVTVETDGSSRFFRLRRQ